jgi:hypothetical protein
LLRYRLQFTPSVCSLMSCAYDTASVFSLRADVRNACYLRESRNKRSRLHDSHYDGFTLNLFSCMLSSVNKYLARKHMPPFSKMKVLRCMQIRHRGEVQV